MEEKLNNMLNITPGAIFSQPWWLDAVAPGSWDEVKVEKGGKLVARQPFVYRETRFGRSLCMPKLTQTLGPWIDVGDGHLTKQLSKYKALGSELIQKLPNFVNFSQSFHYSIDNWLPWYWADFKQTTRYTYVIESLTDHEALWNGLASGIKTDIRKAKKTVRVHMDDKLDAFMMLNKKVFERQKIKQPYSRGVVDRVHAACASQNQNRIFVARDESGRAHAGVYLVWDNDTAYYLMGGGDPDFRSSGATSYCLWEAIKFASLVTKKFDFEGSMIEPVERFVRGFGGRPLPYMVISKMSPHWRVLSCTNKFVKKVIGK